MEQKLKEILENIPVDQEDPDFEQMKLDIKKQMPGYEVELIDMDDFNSTMEVSWVTADAIGRHAKDGIEEVVAHGWYSDDEELAVMVVAIKTKN